MTRKTTTSLTLAAFAFSTTACMTVQTRHIRTAAEYPPPKARILVARTADGAEYTFPKSSPGRVLGMTIKGTAIVSGEKVALEGPFGEVRKREDGSVYEVVDGAGRTWPVIRVLSSAGDSMAVQVAGTRTASVTVPLSEVRTVRIRKLAVAATALAAGGGALVGIFILIVSSEIAH